MGANYSVLKTEEIKRGNRTYSVRLCNTSPVPNMGPGRPGKNPPIPGHMHQPDSHWDVRYETRTIFVEEKYDGGKWKRVWSDKTFERPGTGDPLDDLDEKMSAGRSKMAQLLAKFKK
ncbi:MAG: hypothetical protein SGILL_009606 [Bacillariaceae sp.]